MKYYVSVLSDTERLVDCQECGDFDEALSVFADYAKPRFPKSVLSLTTEVIGGQFYRAYTTLHVPERLDSKSDLYHAAAKASNAFEYDQDLTFLVESEAGKAEREELSED